HALFSLRRQRRDSGKEIFRHVIQFGKNTRGDPEAEAQFLSMCFLVPQTEGDLEDGEVRAWIAEFQQRLEAFTTAHPNFRGLRKFTLPQDLSPEAHRQHILSDLAAIALPSW